MFENTLNQLPFAHRGLHNNEGEAPENTMLAFKKAIDAGFAIECDVKVSKDGKVVVFHDDELIRLCGREEAVETSNYTDISDVKILKSLQTIPCLADVLELVDGRVPLVIELKSFDSKKLHTDGRLEETVLEEIRNYTGPLALKSFNPLTIAKLKSKVHPWPVGFLSCNYEKDEDLKKIAMEHAYSLTHLTADCAKIADFISYSIDDLTPELSQLCKAQNKPLMVWTIRTKEQFLKAQQLVDNIVFEWREVKHNWKSQKL